MRPLHMLVFLLPILIAYEAGSILYLTDRAAGVQRSVEAYKIFGDFFHVFGLAGVFLPGVALVTVLVTWHIMIKDRWRLDLSTLAGMLAESIAWTLPLLVLAAASDHARAAAGVFGLSSHTSVFPFALAGGSVGGAIGDPVHDLPLMARVTIAIGAGLYEEMLFRLVGMALLHFILVDLIAAPPRWGMAIAIVLSALAFAVYHRPELPAEWPRFVFYTLSGIYLGTVYLMRGFGITVGTHAMYDILVLVVFPSLRPHG